MKKTFWAIVFVFVVSVTSFGQEMKFSIGGGLLSDFSFPSTSSIENEIVSGTTVKIEEKTENTAFGAFFFFDATYVEANFTFLYGLPYSTITTTTTGAVNNFYADNLDGSSIALEIGLLGKYPFLLGRFTLFPLLGINYQLVVYTKIEDTVASNPQEASTFGFQGGAGTDFALTEKLFLRGELLYSIRIPNKVKTDAYEDVSFEQGFRFKLGIGYSF
jgi:opacity protein-like surface antigen